MARTDVHRPSAINPEDYEFVAFAHVPPSECPDPRSWAAAQAEETAAIRAHFERTGGTFSSHEHGGTCHICGATASWTVCFYHTKTNTYIKTGRDCADKLELAYGNFEAFKKDTIKRIEALAGKRRAEATLEAAGFQQAWEIAQGEWQDAFAAGPKLRGKVEAQNTVRDIVGKLIRYGSISEKQEAFLRKLLERINGWGAEQARREAEVEAAAPAPSGRVTVTGKILSVKDQDSDFGVTFKLLLQATEGYKVWATVPGALWQNRSAEDLRGLTITIKVTLTPSPSDTKFAFGKRPVLVSEEGK